MDINENDIHILFGEVAQGCFKIAFKTTDQVLIQCDCLGQGRIKNCSSLEEWKYIRKLNYLENFSEDHAFKTLILNKDLIYNAEQLKNFDTIYIWAGIGLEEQLLILFVIYLTDLVGGDCKKIKLVQYETMPGESMPMYCMGYISPEQFHYHPKPISLTQRHIELYRDAWKALTSTNPEQLMALIKSDDPLIKHTSAALGFMLRRYPRIETGLDYWDYQLLLACKKQSNSAANILRHVCGSKQDGDFVHWDSCLYLKLCNMASSKNEQPLLNLSGKRTAEHASYQDVNIALTEFGQAVRAGEISSYPTNPINTWVGGVHLSSQAGNLFFYNQGLLSNY